MRPKILIAAALLVLCGGCVTAAEQRAMDEGRCRGYGFRAGSDAFANCLLQIDLDRSAERRYRLDTAFSGPGWYGYYGPRW